ncbi:hypothetical protein DFH07DRAFT_766053 [Mycena maculata]|uniref:Uncharacterized protein n=1 Tax=Mycena maculata TaxID=230809 RepID=A0AAD7NX73_9AGAR|nr:hypothetical protein DFH07DRAFT_766053 [Mycena maculata]
MTRPKRQVKRARDSSGTFISNKRAKIVLSKPGDSEIEIDIDTSDSDYDAEDEPSESELDNESDDEYLTIPEPSTWLATLSLASEVQPGGTIQKGGAKDKTGKLCGAYLVGGISQREAERRQAAAWKQQDESNGRLGPEWLESQYNAIRKFQSPPAI